jgi:hypothetical protein
VLTRRSLAPIAVATLLIAASSAQATVSIDTSRLSESCPTLGVWFQRFSGGPRSINAAVASDGVNIARRTLTAGNHWHYYELACLPTGTYTLTLTYRGRVTVQSFHTLPVFTGESV